jgi:Fe-S oxidoreductase
VHCGICAEACLFYTETGDPKYTPIHKLEPLRRVYEQEYTLLGRLEDGGPVQAGHRRRTGRMAGTGLQLLHPVRPLFGGLPGRQRHRLHGAQVPRRHVGFRHAPEGIIGAVNRTVTIGSPMGVKLPAVKAQMKHVEEDYGLPIPMDAEGAEYMVMLSSMEIINFPEYLGAIAKIMNQAGKTWTLCSTAFEATNAGMQIGNSDLAKLLVSRIVDGAERLKVKTVISPECGHAYTALRWEGANLIGRPFTFKVSTSSRCWASSRNRACSRPRVSRPTS